jgi:hypothetical protein
MPLLQQSAEEQSQKTAQNDGDGIDDGSQSKHGKTSFFYKDSGIISRFFRLGNQSTKKRRPLTVGRQQNIITKRSDDHAV